VLEQIVRACLETPAGADAEIRERNDKLLGEILRLIADQPATYLSGAQESRERLESARADFRKARRPKSAGPALAGALAVYLVLALVLGEGRAGLSPEIIGIGGVLLAGWLAWRLRQLARGEQRIRDAAEQWRKVLREAIVLPLIAEQTNKLLGIGREYTMDMADARVIGNGRDSEVPVFSAAMEKVAATASAIGSGSIGISGPRGAGKSTILNKFDTRGTVRKSNRDIRVTVSAPVDYDAREFIIHLFTQLCRRVEAVAPALDDIALITQGHIEHLHFQRTYSSSWGSSLTPAFLGLTWSGGRERAEQPDGLPTLVDRFRDYSQQVAEWNWTRNRPRPQEPAETEPAETEAQGKGQAQRSDQEGARRVIICIDEMDKIRDSGRAEQFLNNIKAIFDVPGCLYLVAISEDAMTVFASQTPAIRTAFDSAFDEIISVPPMKFAEAKQLLQLRTTGVPLPFLALCHVLAGGVPRELIRAVRALLHRPSPQGKVTLGAACKNLIGDRCEVMRQEAILQLGRSGAGGDILAPLHEQHWPGGPDGSLDSGALKAAADSLEKAAMKPDNEQWATMCRDVQVALLFYAKVTELFDENANGSPPDVDEALKSGSDRLIDDLATARHTMRTNSRLAAALLGEPLAPLPVPVSPGVNSAAR
jgi:hypothetical protein